LISADELDQRQRMNGDVPVPEHQTPWQELYRSTVRQHATGACIELATRYIDIIARRGNLRHSH